MTGRHIMPARKRRKRETTDRAYATMAARILRRQVDRGAHSVEAAAYGVALAQLAHDYANLQIYLLHYRAEDPASLATIGRQLGISKQAVAKRVNLGREVADRIEVEGKLPLPELYAGESTPG